MSKKYKTSTTLIIVESPAKCKKIEQYLGSSYKCLASFGHLTELASLKNIDIDKDFNPTYQVINNEIKMRQLEVLRKAIKDADDIMLGMDNDREGEGIAFCIAQLFKLNIEKTKRIVFNEITESALMEAVKTPRKIDMNLVNAQQARQILDLLVGFKVTPMLWKYITRKSQNSLSAGRCQTPALRIIYDNYKEIESNPGKIVYNLTGYFTSMNLSFDLNVQFDKKEEVVDYLDETADFTHIYNCSAPSKVLRSPPEPFTTSRLQQVASNELHYSPKDSMKLCQSLYEGGYITYMRTDSKNYSKEFIENVKRYILKNYDEKYINSDVDKMVMERNKEDNEMLDDEKVKADEDIPKKRGRRPRVSKVEEKKVPSQNAHEAIRPTNISLKELPDNMDPKEKKMYKLIWENSLESCMSSSIYSTITASILAPRNARFLRTSELNVFPGWRIVSGKHLGNSEDYHFLLTMRTGMEVAYKKVVSRVAVKDAKMHITEARLVQLLEEKGIGRPSTFSMLVEKIQERGYVKRDDVVGREIVCSEFVLQDDEIFEMEIKKLVGNEKNKLIIQPLGVIVSEFLEQHFSEIFNYDYTRHMEEALDLISKGEKTRGAVCRQCNEQIESLLAALCDDVHTKYEYKLDETHSFIIGQHGPVIRCVERKEGSDAEVVTFKQVKQNVDVAKLEKGEYRLEDIMDDKASSKPRTDIILGKHEGHNVILKKGNFGLYVSWGEKSKNLRNFGNRPIESITFDEVEPYLNGSTGTGIIREISQSVSIRRSTKGDYIFFKTDKMKKPQFFGITTFESEMNEDYKICDINILKSWIKVKYNIF